MCLIITAVAGLISLVVWLIDKHSSKHKTGLLVLMYFGAALMWSVDGFFALAQGEPFLEISMNDALLGVTVVLCGALLFAVYSAFRFFKSKKFNN